MFVGAPLGAFAVRPLLLSRKWRPELWLVRCDLFKIIFSKAKSQIYVMFSQNTYDNF